MTTDVSWLLDIERPVIIGDDWRKKQQDVLDLPHWFNEPLPHVKEFFVWLRTKEGECPVDVDDGALWGDVRAHLESDPVAYVWHFCFYKDRDKRTLKIASPTPSQLVLLWRFAALVAAGAPVRIDVLKPRQGGFSWMITNLVGWVVFFRRHIEAVQVAQDKETTKRVFRYLREAYEWLPDSLRPASEYSSRTELILREKKDERMKGNVGQDSGVVVQTAGTDFVGTGAALQVLHVSEIGKWHRVCDPEVVYTSVVNAIQFEPGTIILRESTAHGAETFWHKEWRASKKMGREGWNGFTPIFVPWYFDHRNAIKTPPIEDYCSSDDDEFGDEQGLREQFNVTDDQIEWRRRTIQKQPEGRSKVDLFKQEHPSTDVEAWIHADGIWLDRRSVSEAYALLQQQQDRGFSVIAEGDIMAHRELGNGVSMVDGEAVWFRRRRGGSMRFWRWADPRFDYLVGADLAEGGGNDATCIKVYQRVADDGLLMRLCAEWYGWCDEEIASDIMWRLGWYYSTGVGRDRLPAMLAWERNGPGRNVSKWVRGGRGGFTGNEYPANRMYRFQGGERVYAKYDASYGIATSASSKPALLGQWRKAFRDREIQLCAEDIEEAASLTIDDRGRIDTNSRDRFMASVMAAWAASSTPIIFPDKKEKTTEPEPGSVAWAIGLSKKTNNEGTVERLLHDIGGRG